MHSESKHSMSFTGTPEDALSYARLGVSNVRTWSNSVFKTALRHRPEATQRQLVDDLYTRYEAEWASAPGDYGTDIVGAYVTIENTALINEL